MREAAVLLEDMLKAGVITNYAVFGAAAQIRYTEAVLTEDVDVMVGLAGDPGPNRLEPVFDYCRSKGLRPVGAYVQVGDWPVQFHEPYTPLAEEAMREAEVADFEGSSVRVVGADHLALLALEHGRTKDLLRIAFMMDAGATNLEALLPFATRHGLARKIEWFRERFGS